MGWALQDYAPAGIITKVITKLIEGGGINYVRARSLILSIIISFALVLIDCRVGS